MLCRYRRHLRETKRLGAILEPPPLRHNGEKRTVIRIYQPRNNKNTDNTSPQYSWRKTIMKLRIALIGTFALAASVAAFGQAATDAGVGTWTLNLQDRR